MPGDFHPTRFKWPAMHVSFCTCDLPSLRQYFMETILNTNTTRIGAFGILALFSMLAFSGCSQKASSEEQHSAKAKAAAAKERAREEAASEKKIPCDNCGVVVSVKESEQEGKGSGLGVVAGGVAGGVIGNQVGQGTGRDLATIAGVVGGAIAGNTIEKKMKKTMVYDVTVKMENGEERVLRYTTAPGVMAGDKIKVEGEKIARQ